MRRLDDHADALGIELFHEQVGNLGCHALLYLQAACKSLDHPGDLAQPYHFTLRNVRSMYAAMERQEMVLTHGGKRYISDDHHLIVLFIKDDFQMFTGVFVQSLEQFRIHAGHALGCIAQPLTLQVLSKPFKNHTHTGGDLFVVDHAVETRHVCFRHSTRSPGIGNERRVAQRYPFFGTRAMAGGKGASPCPPALPRKAYPCYTYCLACVLWLAG